MLLSRMQRFILFAACGTVLCLWYNSDAKDNFRSWNESGSSHDDHDTCVPIPGLEDVLVVLKTGATESAREVPPLMHTLLMCVPHFILLSDFEEDLDGIQVIDVLASVSPEIRMNNPDFEIYNRLKSGGRQALQPSELAEWSSAKNTAAGMLDNPAWKLDKWKFLPLLHESYHYRPQAAWYVVIEADTYVMWSNLVAWLSQYNASEPHYLGSQTKIGDVVFGHGGSGLVISKPAMLLAIQQHEKPLKHYESYTDSHWAGDCVLGKLMADAGVSLTWSWPTLQGEPMSNIDYTATSHSGKLLCHQTVSYHHMTPHEMKNTWKHEQALIKMGTPLSTHENVLHNFVLPRLKATRAGGDETILASSISGSQDPFQRCRDRCLEQDACLQFSFSTSQKTCQLFSIPNLGVYSPEVDVGWIWIRVDNFTDASRSCEELEGLR